MPELTQEQVCKYLSYNADSGELLWALRTASRCRVGEAAGTVDSHGYRRVMLLGKAYKAHRLVWLCVHGRWPAGQIDHRNGDRADNRIANLRECTNSENQQNQKVHKNNTSGYTGVTFRRDNGKFRAKIRLDGTTRHLGYFASEKDARAAYLTAKAVHHQFNPVPRSS